MEHYLANNILTTQGVQVLHALLQVYACEVMLDAVFWLGCTLWPLRCGPVGMPGLVSFFVQDRL